MFTKLLIANRGEIACRVIETARNMGISTVAVYSDIDKNSRHVRLADESIGLGGQTSAESYLDINKVINCALQTEAQAIHPGYGFLSENAEFAKACHENGIKFIGPSEESILAMGLKDKAKEIMQKADVPVVPGYNGENQDFKILFKEAKSIGFPLLIKAVAGGGGKGMRLVKNEDDFKNALESCKREASSSFNNDIVILEKFIENPRHIEVQVFGDSHGNAVHLFERDCSIQRRHQKIVEEAPAPNLSDSTRESLGKAAVQAVKALTYENAGTVEFIMDSATEEFYFMEMNTRLQVEHPVTEEITGQDLVEWQIRIAGGQTLPLLQEDIKCNGHAIEVRLYAEDPANDFLPQTGTVSVMDIPDNARIDTGIGVGDAVSIFYDPMFAKLIVHGGARLEAVQKMLKALNAFSLSGLKTNQEFLRNIFLNDRFLKGEFTTNFIAEHIDELLPPSYGLPSHKELALASIYFNLGLNISNEQDDPWNQKDNWRLGHRFSKEITLKADNEVYSVNIQKCDDGYELSIEEKKYLVNVLETSSNHVRIKINDEDFSSSIYCKDRNLTLLSSGRSINIHLYVHGSADDAEDSDGRIITPMPGKIIDVLVKKGDKVNKDQPLLIMEAMKMEMTIRAGCSGVVEELPVSANDQVSDGTLLISINSEGSI